MKPEELLESLNQIAPEYIEEARPQMKRRKGSRSGSPSEQLWSGDADAPEQLRASKREITLHKQSIVQRFATGVVAAAACAVFIGGGIFIAKQSRLSETMPGSSSGMESTVESPKGISNMLGGQGELVPVHVNSICNRTILRDDTRYYNAPGAWSISGDDNVITHITGLWTLSQSRDLISDGERIYVSSDNQLNVVDSYGNETPFLHISEICNSSTEEIGAPDPGSVYLDGIWHIWNDADADGYVISGHGAFADDPDADVFTFLQTAVVEKATGNASFQFIDMGADYQFNLMPAPEQRGFYYLANDDLYFAPVSAENEQKDAVLQISYLANPVNTYMMQNRWYIQDEMLYFECYNRDTNTQQYCKHPLTEQGLLEKRTYDRNFDGFSEDALAANQALVPILESSMFAAYYCFDGVLYSVQGTSDQIMRSDLEYQNPELIYSISDLAAGMPDLFCTGNELCFWQNDGANMHIVQISLADLSVRDLYGVNADLTEPIDASELYDDPEGYNLLGGDGVVYPHSYRNDGTAVFIEDNDMRYQLEWSAGMNGGSRHIADCRCAVKPNGEYMPLCQNPDCAHTDASCALYRMQQRAVFTDGIHVYSSTPEDGVLSRMTDSQTGEPVCDFTCMDIFQNCERITVQELYPFDNDLLLVVGYYLPEDLTAEDVQTPARRKLLRLNENGEASQAIDLAQDERVAVNSEEGVAYTYTNDEITLQFDTKGEQRILSRHTLTEIQSIAVFRDRIIYLDISNKIVLLTDHDDPNMSYAYTLDSASNADELVRAGSDVYYCIKEPNFDTFRCYISKVDGNNEVSKVVDTPDLYTLYGKSTSGQPAFITNEGEYVVWDIAQNQLLPD